MKHKVCGLFRGGMVKGKHQRQVRPTSGLSVGERRVFWRVLAACCLDEPGRDHETHRRFDVEEHARCVARTVVAAQARAHARSVA